MPNQFPVFEVVLKKRRRSTWQWCVCTIEGHAVMRGSESTRPAAKYNADKGTFHAVAVCAVSIGPAEYASGVLKKLFET
jgi:hypothetical protein